MMTTVGRQPHASACEGALVALRATAPSEDDSDDGSLGVQQHVQSDCRRSADRPR